MERLEHIYFSPIFKQLFAKIFAVNAFQTMLICIYKEDIRENEPGKFC